MERAFGEYPIQSIIGDKDTYKKIKNHMDPITLFTLELWFKIVEIHKIQEDINILKWVAFDSNFVPARQDEGFKRWVTKGITAWCTLEKKGELESFQDMKDKYDLGKHDFYRYLQLRDYYRRHIRGTPKDVNEVIQTIINSYEGK